MAQHSDMLFAHLDRLPPLLAGQRIKRISQVQKPAAIHRAALQFAASGPPPPDPVPQFGASGVSRGFLDLPHGQVLIRLAGAAAETRPLLLLHDAPGSSLALEPLMQQLASRRRVVTLDLPGGGESPPLALARASLADFAALVERILDGLHVESCDVYGQGFGSSLAIELSALNPRRFPKVTLHGLCLPERSQRQELLERYAPPIELAADGSHWYRTWLMLRDSLIYFPWYEGRASALRRAPGDFDARQLHERTFEVLKQYQGYSQFIGAALGQDAELRCRDAHRGGVALQLWDDPLHPFSTWADRQSALVQSLELPVAAAAAGNWVHALFGPA
jgi:pimeloyl-ACP methyl ester carboxylesterase